MKPRREDAAATLAPPAGSGRFELATRSPDTRLYQVVQPTGAVYWEAVVTLRDEPVRRRFAAELHARAWIVAATDRPPATTTFNLEELHGSIRAAGVAAGGPRSGPRA
jgi:hypothetical protein